MKESFAGLFFLIVIASCGQLPDGKVVVPEEQYILVPFRVGDKWGLADTLGNLKIQPQYDDPIDFFINSYTKESFYYFRKGGKAVLVNHNNEPYLAEFDSINVAERLVYKNSKVGTFSIDSPDHNSAEKKLKVSVTMERPVYEYREPVVSDEFLFDPLDNEPGEIKRRRQALEKFTNELCPEQRADISPYSITLYHNRLIFTENGKQGLANQWFGTVDGEKKLIKQIILPAEYDFIEEVSMNEYIIKKSGKFGIYSVYESLSLALEYEDIVCYKERGSTLLIKSNNRYAIYQSGKKFVTDFEFDNYQFADLKARDYGIVLSKGSKKGGVTSDGCLIPAEYDEVIFEQVGFKDKQGNMHSTPVLKLKRDGKTGAVEFREYCKFQLDVPLEYDDISVADEGFRYMTKMDNKFGLFSSRLNLNIKPVYRSIRLFKECHINNGLFLLFEAVNEQGKKIMVNSAGREYYSE